MSDLYNSPIDVAPVTRARSADLNTIDAAVGAAFDKLPDEMAIKKNTITFAINGGSSGTAYTASRPGVTNYSDGMEVVLRAGIENTGAATLNVNGLGAIAMKRADGAAVQAKDIQEHAVLSLRYSQALNAFILPPVVGSQIAIAQQAVVDAQQKVVDAAAQVTLATNQVTLAAGQVAAATTQAGIASGHAGTASTKAGEAAGSASAAATGASNASGSATLASQWASTLGAAVTAGAYSAREWAIGTFTRGSAGGGSAKDWAVLIGTPVDGTNYSAKHWALQAQAAIASANLPVINPANDANKFMRVNAAGTAYELGGVVSYQEFTSSGTWSKPANATAVYVEIINGGCSGAANSVSSPAATSTVIGGAGGSRIEVMFRASNLPASVTVLVGAGGAAVTANGNIVNGNVGSVSSFNGVSPLANPTWSTINSNAGSGAPADGSCHVGGAGGGSITSATPSPGGISKLDGSGGAAARIANGSAVTATSGAEPGGGGGAASAESGFNATSGAGAKGRVRVWSW